MIDSVSVIIVFSENQVRYLLLTDRMTTSPESNGSWPLKLSTVLHSTEQHLVKNFLSKY